MVEAFELKNLEIREVDLNKLLPEQRNQFKKLVEKFLSESYSLGKAGETHSERVMPKKARELSIKKADLAVFLFDGEKVVGFITGFVKDKRKPFDLHLTALMVEPSYRKRGFAVKSATLPQEIVKAAHEKGFKTVHGIDLLYPSRNMWQRIVRMPIVEKGGFRPDKKVRGVVHGFAKFKPR